MSFSETKKLALLSLPTLRTEQPDFDYAWMQNAFSAKLCAEAGHILVQHY